MQNQARIFFSFTIWTVIFFGTTAQTLKFGTCKSVQGVDYMDHEKLFGIWYEYSKSPWLLDANSRCSTFVFSTPVKGETTIEKLQYSKFLFWEYQENDKKVASSEGAGKGMVSPTNYQYTYLDVDYDKYLVIYACQDLLLSNQDVTLILTRERFPSCDVILKAYEVIWEYGLSLDNMKKTNQTDCPDSWDANSNLFDAMFQFRG